MEGDNQPSNAESGTSSSKATDISDVAVGLQQLAAGKRHLIVKDIPSAVEALGNACQVLAAHYGESAAQCGDAYFNYGKALLELARIEDGVLENMGLNDADEDEEDDDDDEEEEEKEENAKKEEEDEDNAEKEEGDEENESEEAGKSEDAKETESIGSNEAGPSADKEGVDKSKVDAEDEEDPSNLQLAWEMLELARSCLKQHADSLAADCPERMAIESKLSDTYQLLGELSVENENYPQAVDDLTTCLRRRQELLPDDSRSIAEALFQLGNALGFNMEFDLAVDNLNEAIGVLEKRIQNLKNKCESEDTSLIKDAFYSREREIAEIESLIPEIREKIADTLNMQDETVKKIGDKALLQEEKETSTSAAAFSAARTKSSAEPGPSKNGHSRESSRPTTDISFMVKKRKKPDDESAATDSNKKLHVDSGNGASNGCEN